MTDDEHNKLDEMHEWMAKIRSDLYTPRPSDDTTLLQRLARNADNMEKLGYAGRWSYWIFGFIAAVVLGWAQFKDQLVRLLGGGAGP